MGAKSKKGTVVVGAKRGSLFLRWQFEGRRYEFYPGLPDSGPNRQVAQNKAHQIEWDIRSGHFDRTLKAYRPSPNKSPNRLSVVGLLEAFIDAKRKQGITEATLWKYKGTIRIWQQYDAGRTQESMVQGVGIAEASAFITWFQKYDLVPRVKRERIELLNAAWTWAIKNEDVNELVVTNPWTGLSLRIKVPPQQAPKPFSLEEIGAIVRALLTDSYYAPYAAYVQFLFGTGCRTSEAIGLQWKHVKADCSSVWIGETLTRGVRQSTKTNRARTVTMTPSLQKMLLGRRPEGSHPEALVFAGPTGKPISDGNFRNRAWKTVLTRLEIDYRKPYTTRSTLISHALDLGKSPLEVAQLTGHDVQVLFKNYAGSVSSRPRLPDLTPMDE
jgi:integrase